MLPPQQVMSRVEPVKLLRLIYDKSWKKQKLRVVDLSKKLKLVNCLENLSALFKLSYRYLFDMSIRYTQAIYECLSLHIVWAFLQSFLFRCQVLPGDGVTNIVSHYKSGIQGQIKTCTGLLSLCSRNGLIMMRYEAVWQILLGLY